MTQIKELVLDGERPLYARRDIALDHVTIGEGESGLKECRRVTADHCTFEGMYVLWECDDVMCRDCYFAPTDRAPVWYSRNLCFDACRIDAPKIFREVDNLVLRASHLSDGSESFWHCRDGRLNDVTIDNALYPFLHAERFVIDGLRLQGKYAFQYAGQMEIHNAVLDTKDAFWESRDCVIYDSEIRGEYLGWYARNLRLVRCHIAGTQPLCYCENLVLEDCTMAPDADLAFEYSSVRANILSPVASIKNPLTGSITCESCGEIIRDASAKAPNDCIICTTHRSQK